jgi:hypothetical protein
MSIIPAYDIIDSNSYVTSRSQYGIETVHHDDADGTITINKTADIEPILEHNKRYQNSHDGYTPSRDMRHVAEIPWIVIEQWNKTYGVNVMARENEALFRRILNNPDNRLFRTGLGQI